MKKIRTCELRSKTWDRIDGLVFCRPRFHFVWTAGSKPHMASQDHLTQEKSYIASTNVDLEKSIHHQIKHMHCLMNSNHRNCLNTDQWYHRSVKWRILRKTNHQIRSYRKHRFDRFVDSLIDTRFKKITIDHHWLDNNLIRVSKKSRFLLFKNQSKRFVCDNNLKKHFQKWRNFRITTRLRSKK